MILTPVVGALSYTPTTGQKDVTSGQTDVGFQGKVPQWHQFGAIGSYAPSGERDWQYGNTSSYFAINRLQNGSVLAAFEDDEYSDCGRFSSPCTRTGFRIIKPNSGEIVQEWSYPVRSAGSSEVHDVEKLPNGNYILSDMEYESIIEVNESGSIVWHWNASSYYESPPDPTKQDWLHINDVDRIGEDRYLVSVRNENELLIIERGEGVVEQIGGDGVLRQQHNPQMIQDDTILVADSHHDRIVELRRFDSGWRPVWSVNSVAGTSLSWPRDADRLPNGNTLITDSKNNRVIEVNENGTVIWVREFDRLPYEADRLPHGELRDVPRYNTSTGSESSSLGIGRQRNSVSQTILQNIGGFIPLPVWFEPPHLWAISAGVILLFCGIATSVSRRHNIN
jgi:hypothetical protein